MKWDFSSYENDHYVNIIIIPSECDQTFSSAILAIVNKFYEIYMGLHSEKQIFNILIQLQLLIKNDKRLKSLTIHDLYTNDSNIFMSIIRGEEKLLISIYHKDDRNYGLKFKKQ